MQSPALPPPLLHLPRSNLPVLISVPHAGRDYPDWLLDLSRGGRESLRPLEDPLVDRLVEAALDKGFGAVIARAPRAAVDCNRAEEDIDPTVVATAPLPRISPRARGGLGIVPGRTASHGPLWKAPIRIGELEARLDQAHRPYHRLLGEQLSGLFDRFGCALLLDCHSMPPLPGPGASVIFGDRHGRTADRWMVSEAVRVAAAAGYRTAVNDPFAGGHVIERHGAPAGGVHAIQVEIDRRCYLDRSGTAPGPGFDRAARLVLDLATRLGEHLLERRYSAAAE